MRIQHGDKCRSPFDGMMCTVEATEYGPETFNLRRDDDLLLEVNDMHGDALFHIDELEEFMELEEHDVEL